MSVGAVQDAVGDNFYPSTGSPLIAAGSVAYPSPVTIDFNNELRSLTAPTVGAYVCCCTVSVYPLSLV